MPSILDHQSSTSTKLLLAGHSGAGKTGALMSLAAAGYKLRILDLDNGVDILKHYSTHPTSPYPKRCPGVGANIRYQTITEEFTTAGKRLNPTVATVWNKVQAMMANWDDGTEPPLGPFASWGPDDILVVDSLSRLSDAAFDMVLALNGRIGKRPEQADWGLAQDLVGGFLEIVTSKTVKCNVIILAHITYIGNDAEGGVMQGFPASLGRALPPKIGRYFNTILLAKSSGQGPNAKHQIHTNTSGVIELKTTAPLAVAPVYDISDGLAKYFEAVRGAPSA